MSGSAATAVAASPDQALRRLFLTLFLRGRSSRGLRRAGMPKSIGARLALTLFFYAVVGLVALAFATGSVFSLALYLHGMTLVFCGLFIAASAGETLFNKEEADILLHRPITPQALLRAKLSVLVRVSLWIAGAFNLTGTFAGLETQNGTWLFPLAHAFSTVLEALFCTGCVVLGYELCLRCFGRELLENVMTAVQIVVAVGAVLAGQLVPRLLSPIGPHVTFHGDIWWIGLLPPAWFAGFDDALAGSGDRHSWALALTGLVLTTTVVWLALGRMARHYEKGLQMLSEAPAPDPARHSSRRWLASFVESPPVSWWLRDPVSRASFFLTICYLLRDRDVKLRVYPGLAPMLIMPVVMLLQDHQIHGFSGFGIAFAGGYLGIIPMLAVSLLQYSQQWQASDVFRLAPIVGPGPLCAGTRQAVTCFLTVPLLLAFGAVAWLWRGGAASLPLVLPGLLSLPVYTLIPHLGGKAVPFSAAGDEARSASRGLSIFLIMLISFGLSALAMWAWTAGWFRWLVLGEIVVVAAIYIPMRRSLAAVRWASDDDDPPSKRLAVPVTLEGM